jgi:hypothetical protein
MPVNNAIHDNAIIMRTCKTVLCIVSLYATKVEIYLYSCLAAYDIPVFYKYIDSYNDIRHNPGLCLWRFFGCTVVMGQMAREKSKTEGGGRRF